MSMLLVCAGYMATGGEENVMTADIPVCLGFLLFVTCCVLQCLGKMYKGEGPWKAEDVQ